MDLQSLKLDLIEWMTQISDPSLLQKIMELREQYGTSEDDFSIPGQPMSLETYQTRIQKAREEVAQGKYTAHEDLQEEAKSW